MVWEFFRKKYPRKYNQISFYLSTNKTSSHTITTNTSILEVGSSDVMTNNQNYNLKFYLRPKAEEGNIIVSIPKGKYSELIM